MAVTAALAVTEPSQVSPARRAAAALAGRLGFDDTRAGQVALVASELATNLAKHARDGELLVSAIGGPDRPGVEILALDRGPGLLDLQRAARQGFSTAGTSGQGLGAIQRLSDHFDVYSQPTGTAAVCRIWSRSGTPAAGAFSVSGISVPKPGEDQCGDDWSASVAPHRAALFVVDGLGHGVLAAEAAATALAVFTRTPMRPPAEIVDEMHGALRPTRGGAVGIAAVDLERGIATYAGLGNISGAIVTDQRRRGLVSHNGTAGHMARKVQEFTYPMDARSTLVLYSDGLGTHWNPDDYPGLWNRDPALIVGVLYRDFSRRRDDVTVVVGRARIG